MRERFAAMREGMAEGARETPREFFAPLIELGRCMSRVSDAGMAPPLANFTLSPEAEKALVEAAENRGLALQVALELAIQEFSDRT